MGSAEAAGGGGDQSRGSWKPGKGFWDLFTFIQNRQRGCRCSFHIYFPTVHTHYLYSLICVRFFVRLLKTHFTPQIRPQRVNAGHLLSKVSAWTGCPPALPASHSKASGSPPGPLPQGQAPGTQGLLAGAGQEVPRGHTPPCVPVPCPGGHRMAQPSLDGDSREMAARAAPGLEFTPRASKREHQGTSCSTEAHSYYPIQ